MTGYLGHPSRRGFLLRIVLPIFAVAILVNLAAGGLLLWSSREADRVSIDRQRALVDLVVSQLRATVAHDQESVTVWDDAVNGVLAGDAEWLDVNLGGWMNSYFGHDAAYIIAPDDRPIYASVDGQLAEPAEVQPSWPQIGPLVSHLRRRLGEGDVSGVSDRVLTAGASDIVVLSDRPAIVSAKPIVSDSGEIEQVAGAEYIHVAVRYLDDSLIGELQNSYLLEGLRFSWTEGLSSEETTSPLRNSAGEVLGYYAWTPYRPGSAVFGHVWPVLLALFLGGMAALAGLLTVVRKRSLSLVRTQAEIRHLATHDVLTGLPNRSQFEAELDEALIRCEAPGRSIALLYLDLDRFKEVNDTLGHHAGDLLLRQFAERLKGLTSRDDTIARLGGDEFTIIVRAFTTEAEIELLCSKLVETARHPFEVADTKVFIGVSVGVAIAPRDGTTAPELARRADIALYSAKANGRSGYAVFSPDMQELITQRRELEHDLRKALETREQFEVHYQPLFAVSDRSIAGVEALLRWNHPARGRIPPDVFIPLAEECGLIEGLGELVLERACAAAANWRIATLAVNVSAVELKSPTYAMRVAAILMANGFDPRRLELEVTETAMSDKDGTGQRNIAALRELGIRFALDDFGTGFSSLGRLQQLDVDRIKIDRSFVHGFGSDNGDEAIVRAIIDLAKATGLRTTAEGVETLEQHKFLGEIGCDELQGFLLAKPVSAKEIDALLISGRHPAAAQRAG
jgi:diguanylate cyclase (GGDEF)-like protein